MRIGMDVVLGYVVTALHHVQLTSGLVVATSTHPTDEPIAEWCHRARVDCFRGSLEDVAERALGACDAAGAETFVRISGDSPLIDPSLVDHAIALSRETSCDLVTNVFPRSFPRGQSVEVVRRSALASVYEAGISYAEKEHVTAALYAQPESYSIVNFAAEDLEPHLLHKSYADIGLAVDEQSDLDRCRGVVEALHPEHPWHAGWERCAVIGASLGSGR